MVANAAGSVTSVWPADGRHGPEQCEFRGRHVHGVARLCQRQTPPGITGWTLDALTGGGINPAAGSPFADNGPIPNGPRSPSSRPSGDILTRWSPGSPWASPMCVHYYENARAVTTSPYVRSSSAGHDVLPTHRQPGRRGQPVLRDLQRRVHRDERQPGAGFCQEQPDGRRLDRLLDNVTIVPIAAGTVPFVTPAGNPKPVLVLSGTPQRSRAQGVGSLPLLYQWLKNGARCLGPTTEFLTLNNIQKPTMPITR